MEWRRMIYQGNDLGDYYLISDSGEIKNAKTNHIRNQTMSKSGYMRCVVSLGSRKNKICILIHRAVAETFIENPENKPEVNHIDGNKRKNCVSNLEWVTGSENTIHAYKHGLSKASKCESNGLAKLTKEDVDWARSVYIPRDRQYGLRSLSRSLGISHVTLRSAIMYKTWL